MTPRKVFYDELRSDFTLFLAYAAIMRACKRCPKVKAGQPVIIGLVLPDPGDHHIYERAAVLVAHGPSLYADKTTSDRHAVVLSSNFDTKDNKRVRILFGEALKSYDRVLVLSDTAEALPEKFDATADAVVRVGRPDADLVLAAGRCCLGKTIVQKDAELLGMVPLREIKKHLRYDVPVEDWVAAIIGKPAMARLQAAQPSLEDLHGLGEAAEWGRELAIDLKDWKLGKIGWSDVDRGVLLSGPPGTGKTTFAGALARSCDAHLVAGSLGRWQAKGHLGDLLKAMRKAFDDPRWYPAVCRGVVQRDSGRDVPSFRPLRPRDYDPAFRRPRTSLAGRRDGRRHLRAFRKKRPSPIGQTFQLIAFTHSASWPGH